MSPQRFFPLLTITLALGLAACGSDDDDGTGDRGGAAQQRTVSTPQPQKIQVGHEVSAVAVGDGQVFIGNATEGTIQRVDAKTGKVFAPLPVAGSGSLVSDLEIGGGSVWVRDKESLVRADAETGQVVATIDLEHSPNGIAYSDVGVWTAGNGRATRIDPETNKAGEAIETPALSEDIAIENGTVWLPGTTDDGYVERIDAEEGQVNTQPLTIGTQPDPIDNYGGFVWIGDEKENTLRKVDSATSKVVGSPVQLGAFPTDVEASGEGIFVLSSANQIVRVDPNSLKVTQRIPIAGDVADIAVGEGYLWIAEGASQTLSRVEL
jgi:streptogramin lyase